MVTAGLCEPKNAPLDAAVIEQRARPGGDVHRAAGVVVSEVDELQVVPHVRRDLRGDVRALLVRRGACRRSAVKHEPHTAAGEAVDGTRLPSIPCVRREKKTTRKLCKASNVYNKYVLLAAALVRTYM